MENKPYYLRIINNIRISNNAFEILRNTDNLKWILEKEKYEKSKSDKSKIKKTVKRFLNKIGGLKI